MKNNTLRIILSGGGTAGHIYPALAVAEALKSRLGDRVDILFVGAEGKMEMERVPKAGFEIVGLPVAGLQRRLAASNLSLPFKVVKSVRKARQILRSFRPDIVAGFGGYASAPLLWMAQQMGIPTLIQEQNSHAGLTNRILGRRAQRVCVAYDRMERFFAPEKILATGNPLRASFASRLDDPQTRQEAARHFGLDPARTTLLVVGGSLGTRTLNEAVLQHLDTLRGRDDVQLIWQNGRYYDASIAQRIGPEGLPANVWRGAFIERMDLAYALADVVIARAGASTVSELQLIGRPTLFVPSPNVAEDHQTANARALVNRQAALLIPDNEAVGRAIPEALALAGNPALRTSLAAGIKALGKPAAANDLADELIRLSGKSMEQRNVYFIGIGGIGMSALARYFRHEGCGVAGYDRTPSPLTRQLEAEGIAIHYEDNLEAVPAPFRNSATTRIVYTPAVPADFGELAWFRAQGFEVVKRSQALGLIGQGKTVLAVAGTHGKTTTTTMAAYFNSVGAGQGSAFLGGVSKNFGSNLVLGPGDRMSVEADEFDRSFLQLHPAAAVITAMDPDHLDIYGDEASFRAAFAAFADQVSQALFLRKGLSLPPKAGRRDYTYHATDPAADFHAENLALLEGGYYSFDLVFPDRRLEGCRLGIPGVINLENCVGAAALVWSQGFDNDNLKKAIETFSGVQRRFDFWINTPRLVYMDDYAHHPAELEAMLTSVRAMFPGRKITLVFQPHLYTRTRDFAAEFSRVLGLADRLILLPVYPAREEPLPGVCSEMLLEGVETTEKAVLSKEELLPWLEANLDRIDVLITAGAGDIDRFCPQIANLLTPNRQ